MSELKFDWDKDKAKKNLQKHGVSFDEAMTVCDDEFAGFLDNTNHSIGEARYILIGYSSRNNLYFFCLRQK